MKNNALVQDKFYWVYLIGFFLILALPVLNLPPWFSPPDWGKTIIFRIILSVLIFLFTWQVLSQKTGNTFSLVSQNLLSRKNKIFWPFWLLIAFLGINFLATIFSLEPYFSFWGSPYRSGGFLNFAFYIIFAILVLLILKQKDWQKIWDFSIFIGVLVAMIAIFQQFNIFSEILIHRSVRPVSTIGGPIFLAIYLLLLSFLTLSFGIRERKIAKKLFYFLTLLLFIFVILLTWSRAAFIGLAVGFFYFLFFYPKKLIWLKVLTLLFLVLGSCGLYYINTQPELPQIIQNNWFLKGVLSRASIKNAMQDSRFSGWKVSWQAIKDKPILGHGPENFSIAFDKYYDPSLPNISKIATGGTGGWWDRGHNFALDIAITAGIPALIIYLLLFGILFWRLQKLKKKEPDYSLICHGIQATFIGYLTANFFGFDTFSAYLISFLLIVYSLRLISNTDSEKENKEAEKQRFILCKVLKYKKTIIFTLFIFLIWFIWVFNIRPLQINTQVNVALYQKEHKDCSGAINRIEELLSSHSFLDEYIRLKYLDIIGDCIEEAKPEESYLTSKKAIQALKESAEIRPTYTRNWLLLGIYTNYLAEKERSNPVASPEDIEELKEEADYFFGKACQLNPKRQEILIEWMRTDFLNEEYQKAKEKAQKCIELNPDFQDCYWMAGLANVYLNNKKEADFNFEIAKEKGYRLEAELSLLQLTKAYAVHKNYEELAIIYEKLTKIDHSKPQYHASLAFVYREMGDFEAARKEAMEVIELDPRSRESVELFLKTLK